MYKEDTALEIEVTSIVLLSFFGLVVVLLSLMALNRSSINIIEEIKMLVYMGYLAIIISLILIIKKIVEQVPKKSYQGFLK